MKVRDRPRSYARASARAYRMRTRRQAKTEQQDEPEEREEEIVYEVRENVDDLFEGYREETKIIVVAFEVTRKAFFRKDERNNDGALRKRGSTPENLFRNFRKGKTGFMAKTFSNLDDAKAFASDPNEEKEKRKNERAETAEQKTRRTEQRATRLQSEPDCRRGRPAETFYRERHKETIHAHFPNPGEEATEEQKKWQSDFFNKYDAMRERRSLKKICTKRKDENPHAEIKPFNLSYRKFSETSVINLRREQVVVKFAKAEKKVRVVEAARGISSTKKNNATKI